ncbi:hypothetical protein [Burkholderia multivorans]|uniref:hypothetical protein n=1 Tax=Burkholderia multivorans TaxID=87883 RepID=UPI0021BF65D0|nr:hypothetical protein [Burkholderia multivorans]MDN8012393.1 hypothetical protein [Burkholderia multivorans]
MKPVTKEQFDALTTRLLTEQTDFAVAVSRIVEPQEDLARVAREAKRKQHAIDTRRSALPTKVFSSRN